MKKRKQMGVKLLSFPGKTLLHGYNISEVQARKKMAAESKNLMLLMLLICVQAVFIQLCSQRMANYYF